ncbi:MAG: glycosyltransferase family 39 protein [Anaerolineales bacterium]
MNAEIGFEEAAPWLVIFITLFGGILRVLLLGNKGMWLDETFSVWLAKQSVSAMLHWVVTIDQQPPLYYLLLHAWIALNGDTPYYVRLLSALFGAGTIPIIYLIGKRMSGAVAGVAAATLLALSPFNIRFAQDARMYTLLEFNAAVAIYALVRLLTDARSTRPIGSQFREYLQAWRTRGPVEPGPKGDLSDKDIPRNQTGWRAWVSRQRWPPIRAIETDLAWVAFIVFSDATLFSHNTAVLFPVATNIFVLGLLLFQRIKKPGAASTFQAPSLGNWVKAQIGIFVLWSPWIFAFIQQAGRVNQDLWIPRPGWGSVTQALSSFLNEDAQVPANQVMGIWVLYGLALCLGLVHYRKNIARFLLLAVLFAVPLLGELIVSVRQPIFLDRTLIWITIPLFVALAAGIAQLRFPILIILALGVFGTVNLFSASDYYKFAQTEDWNVATRDVVGFVEKDDLILFSTPMAQIPFDYYFEEYDPNSNQVEKYIQVEKHGVPADMFASGILEAQMTESDVPRLVALLRGHSKVWLIYSQNQYTDPKGLIPQTLAAQMKLIQQNDYSGLQVQLYGTP